MSFYNTDYLEHHGVLGQKWGVRRFQNPDGSLTEKGKAHARSVESSKVKSFIDTNNAKTIYKRNVKYANQMAVGKSKQAVNLEKKSKKFAEGTEKNKELIAKSKQAAEESKKFSKLADEATKKLKDIDEGTIKAGRDFIVQRDMNVRLTNLGVYKDVLNNINDFKVGKYTTPNGFGTTEYTVIDTRSTKKSPK